MENLPSGVDFAVLQSGMIGLVVLALTVMAFYANLAARYFVRGFALLVAALTSMSAVWYETCRPPLTASLYLNGLEAFWESKYLFLKVSAALSLFPYLYLMALAVFLLVRLVRKGVSN